jgi:hypothetical protein
MSMAREAGADQKMHGYWSFHDEDIERFAELVAAKERKQCVDVAMKLMDEKTGEHPEYYRGIVVAAAHILTKEHQ